MRSQGIKMTDDAMVAEMFSDKKIRLVEGSYENIKITTPEDLDIPGIIAGLREEGLPNIWIPKADDFVKIDELPLLGSGKLDLVKLRNMAENL